MVSPENAAELWVENVFHLRSAEKGKGENTSVSVDISDSDEKA